MNDDIKQTNGITSNDPLLKVPECAEYLRLGETVVRNLMATGELPFVKYRRRTFVRKSDIDGFIARHTFRMNSTL